MSSAIVAFEKADVLSVEDFVEHPQGVSLQVVRLTINVAETLERVRLFYGAEFAPGIVTIDSLTELVSTAPEDCLLVLVEKAEPGRVVVSVSDTQRSRAVSAALAAGVSNACCSWDESPNITVVVNGEAIIVAPEYRKEVWCVEYVAHAA
jgi:hypothetical protein